MKFVYALMPFLIAAGAAAQPASMATPDWKQVLAERLPLLGHRNWIVIADAAYPAQSQAGVETIYADALPGQVMSYLLHLMERNPHVTPAIFEDKELEFIPEAEAPGITNYRETVHSILGERAVTARPHEQLIAQIGQVSRDFNVLVVKTRLLLPYTSLFLRLDCAYWPADAEARLRKAMGAAKQR